MQEIEIRLEDLLKSVKSISKINKLEDTGFKFNYKLAKICQVIEPIAFTYRETYMNYFKKNGVFDEEQNTYVIKDDSKIKELEETNKSLLNEVHKIKIEKIEIELFDNYKISGDLVRSIMWLIKE